MKELICSRCSAYHQKSYSQIGTCYVNKKEVRSTNRCMKECKPISKQFEIEYRNRFKRIRDNYVVRNFTDVWDMLIKEHKEKGLDKHVQTSNEKKMQVKISDHWSEWIRENVYIPDDSVWPGFNYSSDRH